MKDMKLSEVIDDVSSNYDKEDTYREIFIENAMVNFSTEDVSSNMTGSVKLCYGSEGMNVYVGTVGTDPKELGKTGTNFLSLLMGKEGEYSVGKLMGDSPEGLIITRSIKVGEKGKYFSTLEVIPQDEKTFFEE